MNNDSILVDYSKPAAVAAAHRRIDERARMVAASPNAPKVWEESVKPYRKTRSNQQNAYYWGYIITELCPHYGYNPKKEHERNEMHRELAVRYNGRIVVNPSTGELRTIPGETKNLTTLQWEEYMERIRVDHLVEMGIMLHPPNEYGQEVDA